MLQIDARTNIEELSKALRTVGEKQLPFAFALMATRLAVLVKKGELSVLKARIDRPTTTTLNSLYVKPAKPGKPEARTFFKDAWTSGVPADTYLQQAVKGGRRPHKRFEKALIAKGIMKPGQYALPAASALNQFGNVPRGTIMKILSGLGAAETISGVQANATGSKRSKRKGNAQKYFAGEVDGTQGVWERKKTAWGDAVRPVFIFSDAEPGYRVIIPFYKIAENIVKANRVREFQSAMDTALATKR
jgi:Predicted exosome subunit